MHKTLFESLMVQSSSVAYVVSDELQKIFHNTLLQRVQIKHSQHIKLFAKFLLGQPETRL